MNYIISLQTFHWSFNLKEEKKSIQTGEPPKFLRFKTSSEEFGEGGDAGGVFFLTSTLKIAENPSGPFFNRLQKSTALFIPIQM